MFKEITPFNTKINISKDDPDLAAYLKNFNLKSNKKQQEVN